MDDNEWGEPRSKTVSWHDPTRLAGRAGRLSGLEFLTALMEGTVPAPPMGRLIGMRLLSVGPGEVVFGCAPDESTYNPIGMIHGGLACTMLDSAAGCAVQSTLPAGTAYTSVEIKVSYLRALRAGRGELRAHGWVTKPGRRIAFAEADLRDPDGVVMATASSTCLVIPAA